MAFMARMARYTQEAERASSAGPAKAPGAAPPPKEAVGTSVLARSRSYTQLAAKSAPEEQGAAATSAPAQLDDVLARAAAGDAALSWVDLSAHFQLSRLSQ